MKSIVVMRLLTLAVVVAGLFASFTEAFAGIRDPVYGSLVPPPTSGNSLANVPTQWFKNYVNHFDPQDTRQFLQRVYENREFYDATKDAVSKDAPVFIFLGGEGALTNSWVSQGLMHDYGKKFGAILLGIEHRYYGESVPTNDLSTENLQYLTSEQAIEDVVTYIRNYLKTKLPWNRSRSVVAFGGSYAGTLVGLLRARHPSFIRGAVSSSGPYEPQVDFSEFLEVSTEALRIYGADECVENVRTATELVNTLLSSGTASSYSMLSTDLQTCIPITKMTELDKQNFWFLFSDAMGEIPQYNKENGPGLTVAKVCTRLSDAKRAAGNMGLYKEYMMIFRETQSSSCFPWSYREMIQTLGNTRKGNGMMRQWIYQTCTEWGFYQTTTSANQVFGPTGALTVDYFSAVCQDAYDKSFTTAYIHESTERTRDAYGGWYFQATNVAMANGNIDPWYKLSFFEKCGKRDPSVSIHFSERTAHCAILYPAKPYDLPSLKTARIEIAEQIEKWISTKY